MDAVGIPGLQGTDHIGFTVPDIDHAVTFFRDVIGWDVFYSLGSISDESGTWHCPQFIMGFVEVAFDGCIFEGPIHSLDLPVSPRMLGLCEAMVDIAPGACIFKCVRPEALSGLDRCLDERCCRCGVARRGKMGAVIGEDSVNFAWNSRDERSSAAERKDSHPAAAACIAPSYLEVGASCLSDFG